MWENVHNLFSLVSEKLTDIEGLSQLEDEEVKTKGIIEKLKEIEDILISMNNSLNILHGFYLNELEEIQIMKEFKKVRI